MTEIRSAAWWQAQYEAAQAEVSRQERVIEGLTDSLEALLKESQCPCPSDKQYRTVAARAVAALQKAKGLK